MPGGKKGRYAPPVHMIKLTETREIAPYVWMHPDEGRWNRSRRALDERKPPVSARHYPDEER